MSDKFVDIKKIAIVIGTRPEIIKMAPVIRECQARGVDFFIIHSNQHYSAQMDAIFFDQLELPAPDYNLGVGSGLHANQTGNILIKIEPILEQQRPDLVMVQGDTNTVMAAALAASKLGIKVGHVEAGLRSYDRTMPEETNRVLTDHVSDYLFSVGPNQTSILKSEGISEDKIFEVGNTIADALFQHLPIAEEKSSVLTDLNLEPRSYILLTAHRASNVDVDGHLKELVNLVTVVADRYQKQVVWPIHPRTLKKLDEYGIDLGSGVTLLDPLGYFDFIYLQANASLIMTDSGGIQEEACMLRVPCVTLRQNTERPETVEVGANVLVGRDQELALEAIDRWFSTSGYDWINPFGDGTVASAILDVLLQGGTSTAVSDPKLSVDDDVNQSANPLKFESSQFDKIAVIGLGYIGLPAAAMFASHGINVVGVDVNPSVVDCINSGNIHIVEPGLDVAVRDSVAHGFLHASLEVEPADAFIIAVPTPFKGENHEPDLSFIEAACKAIAPVLQPGNIVLLESTSPVGTTEAMSDWLSKSRPDLSFPQTHNEDSDIRLAHCPERVLPGKVMQELITNDRVIGGMTPLCSEQAVRLYKIFVAGDCVVASGPRVAEMCKLTENSFRDVNIAFANELSLICDELGIDVWEVIALANRHPRVNILRPGPGVGGHCIAVDPWFIVASAPEESRIIRSAREVNDGKPGWVMSRVEEAIAAFLEQHPKLVAEDVTVACYGLAFKPDIDDLRESPALQIVRDLAARHDGPVLAVEPNIQELPSGMGKTELVSLEDTRQRADVHVYLVAHREFKATPKPPRFVVDPVGL